MKNLRRLTVLLALTFGAAGIAAWANPNLLYSLLSEKVEGSALTAPEAYAAAQAGELILIDIRRPGEWAQTGSGEGAARIDLRRADFVDAVRAAAGGDVAAPIALICARGVRSARTANNLIEAGFTNIIDIPEGMLGSAAGPGWIARGLPLKFGN